MRGIKIEKIGLKFGKLKITGVQKVGKNYKSELYVNRKRFYLGTFKCPLLAIAARENKISELNGGL